MPPRITIRDLFWLVLVVAMAVGWWLDRSELGKQRDGFAGQSATLEQKLERTKARLDSTERKTYLYEEMIRAESEKQHDKTSQIEN